jgi:hypothetical protein
VGRQVASTRIADEDVDPTRPRRREPSEDALRERALVAAVAGQDHVRVRRLLVEHVADDERDPVSVGARVQRCGRRRESVDVRRRDLGGPGLQRGDRADAGSRREVEHPTAADRLGMVTQVARDREPAAPCERPVREGGVRIVRFELSLVP